MTESTRLTEFHTVCLCALFICGAELTLFQIADFSGGHLFSLLSGCGAGMLYPLLFRKVPKERSEAAESAPAGRYSKIACVGFALFSLLRASFLLRLLADYSESAMLMQLPVPVIVLLIALLCGYALTGGIRIFGRWSVLLTPAILLCAAGTFVIAFPDFDLSAFPISLTFSFSDVLLLFVDGFSDGLALSFLAPNLGSTRSRFCGCVLGTAVLFSAMLRDLLLLGPGLLALSPHATTNALSLLTLGRGTLHAQIGYAFVFIGAVLIRITLLMTCVSACLKQLFPKIKKTRFLRFAPVALCAVSALPDIPADLLFYLRLITLAASLILLLPRPGTPSADHTAPLPHKKG